MGGVRGNRASYTYTFRPSTSITTLQGRPKRPSRTHLTFTMANRGYDVVVDVDTEVTAYNSYRFSTLS
jgi:hypothetical protein